MSRRVKELEEALRVERLEKLESDKQWHATVCELNAELRKRNLQIEQLVAEIENNLWYVNPNDGCVRTNKE